MTYIRFKSLINRSSEHSADDDDIPPARKNHDFQFPEFNLCPSSGIRPQTAPVTGSRQEFALSRSPQASAEGRHARQGLPLHIFEQGPAPGRYERNFIAVAQVINRCSRISPADQ